jgi:drug/metabolite transporter (DMT)-like permease
LHHTNAGTAQVVIQIAPVLFTLGGIFVFRERFNVRQWLGLALLVAGMVLFSRDQIAHVVAGLGDYYVGLAFMVVAAVAWAAYGLAQKQLLRSMSSPAVMLCIYVGATVIFLPLAAPAEVLELSRPALAALVFCIVNMLAAYGTFAEALVHWEASRVSAVLAIVPLVTLAAIATSEYVLPGLVSPEPITTVGIVGASLVVTGSLLTALGRS